MKHVLFAVCVIGCLALAGCPSPVSNDENPGGSIYAEECWGEWLRVGEDEAWYISGGAIKINGSVSSRSVSLSKQSDRVIQVTEGGSDYYLYASRIANTSFTGKIAGFDDVSPSVQRAVAGGKGWMRVVVEDLDNGSRKTTQTDGNGNFKVDNIIPGDQYQVTPEGGTPVTVTPKGDGDDVGTITITDGVNFKTTGPQNTLLMDRQHNITLSITNTGTEDCTAATYRLEFEDGLTSSASTAEQVMGTIEPGKTKTIDMSLRYNSLGEQYAGKKINITITDQIIGKTWTDSVSVRFYNSRWDVPFRISANSSVSGIIISPDYQTYQFSGTRKTVSVPWSSGKYLVVFSGATADTEAVYSFGVYEAPADNLDGFTELGKYEPNDTEQTAPRVSGASVISYLHKNDVDYYLYKIPNPEDVPVLPDNLSFDASLAWLDENAQSGGTYTINLSGDAIISPKTLSYNGKPVSITLSGGAVKRTVSLSSNGSLFTVGNGVMLTLANNITLRGRGGNNNALVWVTSGGALIMKAGSAISGNTNSSYYGEGGGVHVAGNGTFTMSGGEISGNTAASSSPYGSHYGGGVYVGYNGTFTMSGGEISGNTASSGGGVYVSGGTFAMSGGEISGNTASSGGGVYVDGGTFTKQSGGTIYGSDANAALKNTATNDGHAVYVRGGSKKRNATAGVGVTLDSTRSGTAGGWE